ncbi:MAG: hypothetical protein ACON4U_04445 [Myxococcota bacterium]
MVVVTGTKRSGTSLWMQILIAAGLDYIGSPYLGKWEKSIKSANPNGFFESILRKGIFYATNPHPKTGVYLHPNQHQKTAVKVFIPGLVKSDHAFLNRVIGTIRPWREYTQSLRRLYSMERQYIAQIESNAEKPFSPLELWELNQPLLHPALEWWKENYALILDFSKRRYAFNLSSYVKLQEDPASVVNPVLEWIGEPPMNDFSGLVNPQHRTQKWSEVTDSPLTSKQEMVFDELHSVFYRGEPLSKSMVEMLNQMDDELYPLIEEGTKALKSKKLRALQEKGLLDFDLEAALLKIQEEQHKV